MNKTRIIFAFVAGIIGLFIGNVITDSIWTIGDKTIESISNCDNLDNKWKKQCENTKSTYQYAKSIIISIGFIIPFGLVMGLGKLFR